MTGRYLERLKIKFLKQADAVGQIEQNYQNVPKSECRLPQIHFLQKVLYSFQATVLVEFFDKIFSVVI